MAWISCDKTKFQTLWWLALHWSVQSAANSKYNWLLILCSQEMIETIKCQSRSHASTSLQLCLFSIIDIETRPRSAWSCHSFEGKYQFFFRISLFLFVHCRVSLEWSVINAGILEKFSSIKIFTQQSFIFILPTICISFVLT